MAKRRAPFPTNIGLEAGPIWSSPTSRGRHFDRGTGGGHVALNGVALPANQDNIISATQLSQTTYVAGTGADTLWVKANDGTVWGTWSNPFSVTG
jgi:hypothetical protein